MNWTFKEESLLKDLKIQEALCVEKYGKYAEESSDPELAGLFRKIQQHEIQHLNTITGMLDNRIPTGYSPQAFTPPDQPIEQRTGMNDDTDRDHDAYLCQDALSMEKHVSGVYDTAIFEFTSPAVRQTLNNLQSQEQWHGEQIYAYMARQGMNG